MKHITPNHRPKAPKRIKNDCSGIQIKYENSNWHAYLNGEYLCCNEDLNVLFLYLIEERKDIEIICK